MFIDYVPDVYNAEESEFNPLDNANYNTLLSVYDDLVSEYPEYVSRVFLNNEESGLPLYAYHFKPQETEDDFNDYPKMILTVSHGHEIQATYGLAYFLDDLTRNWATNDALRMLRFNLHLIVVPQGNPYGFNLGVRPNYNGVDNAENFTKGWTLDNDPAPGYGTHGPHPLSEIASQETDKILQQNTDAVFVIDSHNYGGDPYNDENQPLLWINGNTTEANEIANTVVNTMASKARSDGYVPENISLGRVYSDVQAYGSLVDQVDMYGMSGIILESMNTLDGSVSDPNIHKFNRESIGNAVLSAFRYYMN